MEVSLINPIKEKGILVLIGWFCLMYLANAWMPLYRDDYLAALIWRTGDHLQSMDDVFLSLERYYLLHGGRLVSFFIQFVFMLYGKFWFNIANALIFSAMCAVLLMHVRRETKCLDEPGMLFVIGAFMWLGISHFGEIAIWLCGSAVYLWTGFLTAVFLLPYNLALAGTMETGQGWLSIVMLPLGAAAACSVENLTITTTLLALWASVRLYRRGEFSLWMGTGALGSVIGSIVCIAAPGNYVRIEEDKDRSWLFHFLNEIPANLEMVLYMMPVLLTLVLAYRILLLEAAGKRGIPIPPPDGGGRHPVLLGILIITVLSFFTTGFFYKTLEAVVVHGIFFPLGLREEVLLSHFNNTMQGLEEALIYLLGAAYVYLTSVREMGISSKRTAPLRQQISLRDLAEDYPQLRYAASCFFLCVFNNLLMIGAPSFPGRALFSSSILLIVGAAAIIRIPPVKDRLFLGDSGRTFRRGGICLVAFIAAASLVVLHDIWREDAVRVAYIARQAEAGKKTASVPPSAIPERRRILRHIAYDDFDAGMTRDHLCAYYGLDTIVLDQSLRLKDIEEN